MFRQVPVRALVLNKTNVRRTGAGAEADAALAESVRVHGVLVPLLVQPAGKRFEVLAGGRRLKAAVANKLTTLPCLIRPQNGLDATVVSTTENTMRADLAPLEEADVYATLLKRMTLDEIADALGRPVSYIHGRLALTKLIPAAQKALRERRLGFTQALVLATLQPDDQAQALRWCGDADPSARRLRGYVKDYCRLDLRRAAWDLKDPALDPQAGPCVTCPFRAGSQPSLFVEERPDTCTKPACYQHKADLEFARVREARPDLPLLGTGYQANVDAKPEPGALPPETWTLAKSTAQGAAEGLLAGGARKGAVVWFLPVRERACPTTAKGDAEARAEAKIRAAAAEVLVVRLLQRNLDDKAATVGFLAEAVLERIGGDDRVALAKALPDFKAWLKKHERGYTPAREFFAGLLAEEKTLPARHRALTGLGVRLVAGRALRETRGNPKAPAWTRFLALAEESGVDVDDVFRAARAAFAKPGDDSTEKAGAAEGRG